MKIRPLHDRVVVKRLEAERIEAERKAEAARKAAEEKRRREEEAKKKNCEIVELLTKNEFYQYKLDEREIQLNDLRNRLKGLIDDNNELFTQNRKLKYLIESNNNF